MKAIFSRVRHPSHPGRGHGSLTCHMTHLERSDWLRSENFTNIMIELKFNPVSEIAYWSHHSLALQHEYNHCLRFPIQVNEHLEINKVSSQDKTPGNFEEIHYVSLALHRSSLALKIGNEKLLNSFLCAVKKLCKLFVAKSLHFTFTEI